MFRAATRDGSQFGANLTVAAYFGARYAVDKHLTPDLDVFHLAGKKGNDIEHYYASCTAGEVTSGACNGGVNDRHIHPMEPRSVRVSARYTV